MFVKSIGAVFIFGIEHEYGRPRGVKAELAERQQLLSISYESKMKSAILLWEG